MADYYLILHDVQIKGAVFMKHYALLILFKALYMPLLVVSALKFETPRKQFNYENPLWAKIWLKV